jgi:hypothetical protein
MECWIFLIQQIMFVVIVNDYRYAHKYCINLLSIFYNYQNCILKKKKYEVYYLFYVLYNIYYFFI